MNKMCFVYICGRLTSSLFTALSESLFCVSINPKLLPSYNSEFCSCILDEASSHAIIDQLVFVLLVKCLAILVAHCVFPDPGGPISTVCWVVCEVIDSIIFASIDTLLLFSKRSV